MSETPPETRLTFPGQVNGEGTQIVYTDHVRERFRAALARLPGKIITVVLDRERRSNQANRRYWGGIVPVVQEVLSVGRPLPLSKDQTHWLLKFAFLGQDETLLGPVPKSTAKLSTREFWEYCNRIESHFVTKYGITFPDPGELAEEAS